MSLPPAQQQKLPCHVLPKSTHRMLKAFSSGSMSHQSSYAHTDSAGRCHRAGSAVVLARLAWFCFTYDQRTELCTRGRDLPNMLRASSAPPYLDNTAQRLLFMEAAIGQDEDELVQGGSAATALCAVPCHVQHVHQHCQQLHHWPVSERVVLQCHPGGININTRASLQYSSSDVTGQTLLHWLPSKHAVMY